MDGAGYKTYRKRRQGGNILDWIKRKKVASNLLDWATPFAGKYAPIVSGLSSIAKSYGWGKMSGGRRTNIFGFGPGLVLIKKKKTTKKIPKRIYY